MLQALAVIVLAAFLAIRLVWRLPFEPGTRVVAGAAIGLSCWLIPAQILGAIAAYTRWPIVQPWLVALVLAGMTALDLLRHGIRVLSPVAVFRQVAESWRTFRSNLGTAGQAVLGMAGFLLILDLIYGLMPSPVGWDAVHYHVPRALNFVQDGLLTEYFPPPGARLEQVENALGYNACHAYPGNWSLYLSLLARFRDENLLDLAQFPFLLLGGVLVWRLARLAGAAPALAAIAAAAWLTAPLASTHGVTAYADMFAAVFLLAGLLFLLEPSREPVIAVALAGLCIGISIGGKSTSLIYAPLLALVATFRVVRATWRRPVELLKQGAAFAAMILLPSAFWFGQNWVLYGSPVVPFRLSIAGITLFPGKDSAQFDAAQEWVYVSNRFDWLTYPWHEKLNYESGFGMLWAAMLPLAALGVVRGALRHASGRETVRNVDVIFFLIVGSVWVWWKLTHHEPRYMMHLVGLVPVLAVFGASALGPTARLASVWLLLLCVAGNGILGMSFLQTLKRPGWTGRDYAGAFSKTSSRALAFIDTLPPARIFNEKRHLVESTTVAYGLYGSRFQHRVVEDQNLRHDSPRTFHRNLRSRNIQYLFLLAEAGEPYLARYTPEQGFRLLYREENAGIVVSIYHVETEGSSDG